MSDQDIKEFQERTGFPVMLTSAKNGINVDESFLEMTKKLIIQKNMAGDDKALKKK